MQEAKQQDVLISNISKNIADANTREFIDQLFHGISYEDLSSSDPEFLLNAALSTFSLLQNRQPDENKVNIFYPKQENNIAVIEVVMPDIPFLVDSIGNELKKDDFNIHLIMHPTIYVSRDSLGNFVSIGGSKKEAVMQFYISNFNNENVLQNLYQRIVTILDCVSLCVCDWKHMRTKMLDNIKALSKKKNHQTEHLNFLEWLVNDNFVFLGVVECEVKSGNLVPYEESVLGILKNEIYTPMIQAHCASKEEIIITKWDSKSLVHRNAYMDSVMVQNPASKNWKATIFLGFFTSSAYFQSINSIPLIKQKVANIVERYGYPKNSHNTKELLTALEDFPRSDLLQMEEEELYNTATGIVSLSLRPRVRLFIHKDRAVRFLSCLVFIPRSRFSTQTRETVERILSEELNSKVSRHYIQIGESQLVRLQILVKIHSQYNEHYDVSEIEAKIINAISMWEDRLQNAIFVKFGKEECVEAFSRYKQGFDIKYQSTYGVEQAAEDIAVLEEISVNHKIKFIINQLEEPKHKLPSTAKKKKAVALKLKVYSLNDSIALSDILRIIEHLGFFTHNVTTFHIQKDGLNGRSSAFIQDFMMYPVVDNGNITSAAIHNLELAFEKVWYKFIDDDRFNNLITAADITWRQTVILRAIAKYLKQIKFEHFPGYISEALKKNASLTKKLVQLFEFKFHPTINSESKYNEVRENILESLQDVESLAEDQVVRAYLNILDAIKRTNYYQLDSYGSYHQYFAIKLAPREIEGIVKPAPFAEIYVYSTYMEGHHLRDGLLARGGLRWSSRLEDPRTEVLGLVKAQITKNAAIVPVGAKGCFIVKYSTNDRAMMQKKAVECYKTFLSGMLDITDNVVDSKVVKPDGVVIHDNEDPYLVVAADKGTATFSDYANEVSNQYNFWLGDAFASGGSVGYDHKKIGITAKGAWISVVKHFEEMGRDISAAPFTVVGIGDMSGDVFGNGMLLSKNIKLIAAFNHMHIFIDPNPNPENSFKERTRLFANPALQWLDYSSKVLSKGGGVYERKAKKIKLSKEAVEALGLTKDSWTPDELIHNILQAPVDLLWSAGIGTFIKSSLESHDKIGDKINNGLRVDASQLRCKIIGEGGNLGMTQLARIEYYRNGGRVNTDFIDNVAGVDCSDHEVNIKIAITNSFNENEQAERSKLLADMTADVEELVLKNNVAQTLIISMEEHWGKERVNEHQWFIQRLEQSGELSRDIENIPTDDEINEIKSVYYGLSRPSIAVLIAYAKISIHKRTCHSIFSEDKYFHKYLINYFPKQLHGGHNILEHPLKERIILNELISKFVNTMGCCFFHRVCDLFEPVNIIKAFYIAFEVLEIQDVWNEITNLLIEVRIKDKVALLRVVQSLLEREILWVLEHYTEIDDVSSIIAFHNSGYKKLCKLFLV